MDTKPYDSLAYVQNGHFCVLASYATALWPWIRTAPLMVFVAYCEHFRLPENPRYAETTYRDHFKHLFTHSGLSGYKIIEDLHENSTHPVFQRARKAAQHSFYASIPDKLSEIELVLERVENSVLMAFVNTTALPNLSSGHSVSIIRSRGAYHCFDSNHGRLQLSIASLSGLGDLGEGIVFVGKESLAVSV